MIYFVECAETGLVKIGRSGNPKQRLAAMQAGSATKLRLVGAAPGGPKEEIALHRRYKSKRVHGEWFRLTASDLKIYRGRAKEYNQTAQQNFDTNRLGERVRKLRQRARLSQASLAETAGVHTNTIAALELGRAGNIGVRNLDSISTVLGERIDILIRRAGAVR